MSVTRELPRYQRLTQVSALKIKHIIENPRGWELHFEDERYAPLEVSDQWLDEYCPAAGGYFVWHDNGAKTYLSAAAFEARYTPVS